MMVVLRVWAVDTEVTTAVLEQAEGSEVPRERTDATSGREERL